VADETQRRTLERFSRRNSQYTDKGRKRSSLETPLGRKSLRIFLKPVADAIAARVNTAPANLIAIVARIDPYELATITLSPILDGIFWGFDGNDWRSKRALYQSVGQYLKDRLEFAEINVAKAIGKQIKRGKPRAEDFLREEWPPSYCVLAGWWLIERAVESKYFEWRGNTLVIAAEYEGRFKKLRQALLYAEPYHMPHITEPADWTGWRKHYDERISATFVRGWRSDQRTAVEARFNEPFPHAEAVNHRKRVALRINQDMLTIVERFALKVLNSKIRRRDPQFWYKRTANEHLVAADLEDAKWIGDRPFRLDHACDERGRMYALQRFSYDREDHIRSLIEFSHGVRCGPMGIQWLEFNCATHYGIDKAPWAERSQWAGNNRHLIRAVAQDPTSTFDKWRKADKPFQFVRSCIELIEADDNPDHVTHLPVGIDATASGLQHLALLCRDYNTMETVNLTLWHNKVLDIYDDVAAHVEGLLQNDTHPWAGWWLDRLNELGDKRRKLFKGPVGTFAYASTENSWNKQIREAYAELEWRGKLTLPLPRDENDKPERRGGKSAVGYLVDKVRAACEAKLPGPSAVMRWLQDRVVRMYERGLFVCWDSPSGFPCRNLEQPPNERDFQLPDGRRIAVADGALPEMDLAEMLKSIAANFTHSLDAAHAALTINALWRDDITNIITCHDCLYGHAPRMYAIQLAALVTLRDMYRERDPLHELWLRNGAGDPPPHLMDDKQFFAQLDQLPGCSYAFS
jgi:hypothetical protein